MRAVIGTLALFGAVLGCAGVPAPAPGTSQVVGEIRLVRRAGLSTGGGGAYGDLRMRSVRMVDYSKPGFAVVYVEAEPPMGDVPVTIRSSPLGPMLEPREAAVGASGRVVVRNRTDAGHVVSHPASGMVRTLAPGEEITVEPPQPGEQQLYLLDAPEASATIFAAPGPFAIVAPSGHFALSGLRPGPTVVHVWHPRFPIASRDVELAPDTTLEVVLELGVGLSDLSEVPIDAN
jgi:hypothetical protein